MVFGVQSILVKKWKVWFLDSEKTWDGKEWTAMVQNTTCQTNFTKYSFIMKLSNIAFVTDQSYRGAGFISLDNLLVFAKTFSVSITSPSAKTALMMNSEILHWLFLQASFQRILPEQCSNRATWEYPFAVVGVNITFMHADAGSLVH
jgi:hypothetical protein